MAATAETAGLQAKNILVFGATGLIGKEILAALIDAKSKFNRIAIFTSLSTATNKAATIEKIKAEGINVIVGDIKNEKDVLAAYQDIDTVISAVGRDVIADQIPLIKLADQTPSVKWFFPSEYGTDIEYGPSSAHERPHQQKLKVRAALREASSLSYTYVVTGPFADLYVTLGTAGPRGGSFDVKNKTANLLGDGNGRISLTVMADVGKLVVAALLHPTQSRNRALKVNSYTTTPSEILAEFERQTGGEKWNNNVTYTPLDELRELEKQAWETSSPAATVFTLRRIWTEGGTLYEKRNNADIGEPEMETLRDTVGRIIRKQLA
ncbi:hypothetical protein AJ80_00791 [Polytolypa hystricis UAMH7299]|uniref:NmrA-like domain-containing protein n=1 Tax=Polytolypa hystricis (strain UAMH7299) TaxID=1447883 RepID=A0A2B7Z2B8_POLH7|nr:hypothetical protein AJ80_00791 [Polytolypa hystricis UAMH7299]